MAIANWVQVNKDGFGYPPDASANAAGRLVSSGKYLYAHNEHGVFRMDSLVCKTWEKVFAPDECFTLLGNLFYSFGSKGLWWIDQGEELTPANWKQVTSKGLPGGVSPDPLTTFKGRLYAIHRYQTTAGTPLFEIWRSADIGKTVMNWEQLVTQSFGDHQNNHDVDFMGEFNSRIYAGTNTLEGNFGNPQPAAGVEIWESPTGDAGTWTQVNTDGFGTEITLMPQNQKIRTNHVIGSWAVYKALNQTQEYLYIGTMSHWGAEVWRYDGKGKAGWKNVTPQWAGPNPLLAYPGRNNSMAVFQDSLYLAEGYPTGNLAKYDGTNWSIVVTGPNPFDPQNGGLSSSAVFENHLYVHTIHQPYSGATKGDQVWGHPFNFVVWVFACSVKSLVFRWKRLIRAWPKRLTRK